MKKERIKYFDIIKLIAAICVFTCHYTRTLEYWGISYTIKVLPDWPFSIYLGSVGVTLFFIISGAVLMYSYDSHLSLKQYYKKRFIGIYPMFWIAFIVIFCIKYYINIGYDKAIPKWKIIYSILGIDGPMQSISPNFFSAGEWFLGVIIVLYIIYPILRNVIIKYSWIVLLVTLTVGVVIDYLWRNTFPIDSFFIIRIPEFVFGMLFVKYIKRSNVYLALISMYIVTLFSIFDFSNIPTMSRIYIIGCSLFFILVWLFQDVKSKLVLLISNFVSKYIYPIFLIHHQIQVIFLRHFQGRALDRVEVYILWFVTIVLTLVFSYILDKLTSNILNFIRKVHKNEC